MKILFYSPLHYKKIELSTLSNTARGSAVAHACLYDEVSKILPGTDNTCEGMPNPYPEEYSHIIISYADTFLDREPLAHRILTNLRKSKIVLYPFSVYNEASISLLNKCCEEGLVEYCISPTLYHCDDMITKGFKYPKKIVVLDYGIRTDLIMTGSRIIRNKSFVYASAPHRGLGDLALSIWPQITEKYPDAELFVTADDNFYRQTSVHYDWYQKLIAKIKEMKSVHLLGRIRHQEVYTLFQKCTAMLYPCAGMESSCIAAHEALACGCVPVTYDEPPFNEYIKDCKNGILIKNTSGNKDEVFAAAVKTCLYFEEFTKIREYMTLRNTDMHAEGVRLHFPFENETVFSWEEQAQKLVLYLEGVIPCT